MLTSAASISSLAGRPVRKPYAGVNFIFPVRGLEFGYGWKVDNADWEVVTSTDPFSLLLLKRGYPGMLQSAICIIAEWSALRFSF